MAVIYGIKPQKLGFHVDNSMENQFVHKQPDKIL